MNDGSTFDPVPIIADELGLSSRAVGAAVKLFGENATVPFIARYRKEVTGGLDEVALRNIQERAAYLGELEERRCSVIASVAEQGQLTPDLERRLRDARTKADLEDLYLPFKPKRRTRATIARERGLEPLATRILAQPEDGSPEREAAALVDPARDVADVEAALKGARDIVAEAAAENASVRRYVREAFARRGVLVSTAVRKKATERTKFEQYYDFSEMLARVPSHRYLAIRRGEKEGVLRVKVSVEEEAPLLARVEQLMRLAPRSPYQGQLREAIHDGFKRLLAPAIETELRAEQKTTADAEAVDVFADNLRNLLLASPLGEKAVLGIDPGLRTGCKCTAVDATGKYLDHVTIYPSQGQDARRRAAADLTRFMQRYPPAAVAVGNGTGGRETEAFVRKLVQDAGLEGIDVLQVNEAGASVYSASDLARHEFPDLDLTIRGAVSIARRLQDPLAELVKIDPKSIGVGQYQHDVQQTLLKRKLAEVVESCVNHVGVEVNTASAPLLAHVAGISSGVAEKIVAHRETNGAFNGRRQLLKVPSLGPRAFEQAAGFLRIRSARNPLDASAVHPERYALVDAIARDLDLPLQRLVGNSAAADRIDIRKYVSDDVGELTLRDIVDELRKPGRDPREAFSPPRFRDDINELEDVEPGLVLEGVVTNVTAFGAFVDVGVHQDGLVHVSELADRFVKDPREVVRVGDKITVKVLDVDLERRRMALSARQAH